MNHSVPNASAKTSSGICAKNEASEIWLRWHPSAARFCDRYGFTSTEMGEKAILDQIRDYVVKRANEVLPAGQTLTVTFTDIDLAGDFEPWRGGQAMDIRIVKDVYPPRMDLEFRLTDADGAVLKEGKRQLRDLAFLGKININREDPLRHEKNLLDDWFKNEFPKAKSG